MSPPPHNHDESGPPHDHDESGPPHDHDESTEPDRHLFVVGYEDDAERKRAEYLFDTWGEGEITRPDGLVRIAEGVDANSLHRDLLVKFRSDQVESYALTERDDPETPEARTIDRSIDAPADAVESFLQYLVSKKKGTERGDGEYEVYTNKGRADVSYEATARDGGHTEVTVRISGHPPVLDYLTDYVETELREFAASR